MAAATGTGTSGPGVVTTAVVLGVLGLLAWRVLVVGVSGSYADQGTADGAMAALRWRPDLPDALGVRAEAMRATDGVAAGRLWQASIRADPTNSVAYLRLAGLRAAAGRPADAGALAAVGDALGPMHLPALALSADFWFAQGRSDLGVARWSDLMTNRPESEPELFPRLLDLAGSLDTRPLLQPLLDRPPVWWDRFFGYAAAKAPRVETLMFLYDGRNRGAALPARAEQVAVLDRLWAGGRWREAYLVWLQGLDESSQRSLGNLNNGGFDQPITGIGFDWRIKPQAGVTVETSQTYGTRGARALHLVFDGRPVLFQHLSQALLLEPGRYRLQGRVRPDGLEADRGLRWMIGCGWGTPSPVATSDAFSGKDDWQSFSMGFAVPEAGCDIQVLRLEQAEPRGGASERPGAIWFDDLSITRGS